MTTQRDKFWKHYRQCIFFLPQMRWIKRLYWGSSDSSEQRLLARPSGFLHSQSVSQQNAQQKLHGSPNIRDAPGQPDCSALHQNIHSGLQMLC